MYEGAPTPVTLFIGTAPKIAAFGMLMRALVEGPGALQADWTQMLAVLSMGGGRGHCAGADQHQADAGVLDDCARGVYLRRSGDGDGGGVRGVYVLRAGLCARVRGGGQTDDG